MRTIFAQTQPFDDAMKPITVEEIQILSQLIFDLSGLHLGKDKGYLLETRLNPLLSSLGCTTFTHLHAKAKADNSGQIHHKIVEAMTTNETFFFRDNTPFELLRNKIIPDLIDRRASFFRDAKIPIRIWSAACSTGQEVYTIAMTLVEILGNLSRYDIYILGTDIADKVITQASYGKYNQFEMERGLPLHYRKRYFSQLGTDWRINDEIRSLAQFRKLNLMKPFPDLGGKFDVIFCRNVAIYFNQPDKIKLFQKIARVLQPDGALIVGGSETLSGIAPDFESRNYVKGIFYQLKGVTAALPPRPPPPPLPKPTPVMVREKVYVPPVKPSNSAEAGRPFPLAVAEAKPGTPGKIEYPTAANKELAPNGPDSQPIQKKSLLSSIHSKKEQGQLSLLNGKKTAKISLLEQLARKKNKGLKEAQ